MHLDAMHSFCLRKLALLLSFTGLAHCVTVTIPNPTINVTAGNSVTLNCAYSLSTLSTNTHNLLIQWNMFEAHSQQPIPHSPCASLKNGSLNQCIKMSIFRDARGKCSWRSQVYYFQNGQSFPVGRFKDRVTAYNNTGNASITISNMQPQETGFYTCEVTNLPDPVGMGHIQVIIMVAPSTPHCAIEGHIVIGHSVTLSCLSKQGMPRPVYTWHRVKNDVLFPVNSEQSDGLLVLGNMTKFEDGYYRCTASNSLGNATCEMDLHTGGEGGIIVAAVIGAVFLSTIIFVVIWFLVAKKKNKAKKPVTEMKTMSTSAGPTTAQSEAEEQARQNLVVTENPEVKEYSDQPEYAIAGEAENPAV
ncbi:V-set and immunoglobulin domain-containing protein 1 isoform X1 [Rana temporaria]|uniref:V-set and immunoglobulin domain-containing protein 1 isoform X1 n=1 Tax=Rana temporaria TaxID=8407 RepID=UPI001AACBF50|nr:V-set and immunoglobulin domain-containing protein 1 isoform X1 [Rana temporaria]